MKKDIPPYSQEMVMVRKTSEVDDDTISKDDPDPGTSDTFSGDRLVDRVYVSPNSCLTVIRENILRRIRSQVSYFVKVRAFGIVAGNKGRKNSKNRLRERRTDRDSIKPC